MRTLVRSVGRASIGGEPLPSSFKAFEANKLNKIAEIAINTAVAVSKAIPNVPLMALTAGLGAVQAGMVAATSYVPMAKGGSGTVTKPTLFLAGEAGAEDFAFKPRGKGGMGGKSVVQNFYISGSVVAEKQVMALGVAGIAKASRGY